MQRALDAGATVVGKANLARVRVGRARREPVVRHRAQPAPSREDDGRLVGGNAAAIAAGLVDARHRDRHRLLDQAALGRVRTSSGSSRGGDCIPLDGVLPALPVARHGRADGADGRGRRARSGRCSPRARAPEPRLDGLTVGLLRQAPELGDGRETETSDARRAVGRRPRARSARASSRPRIPAAQADIWPLFLHEAARLARETFPSRADEYGDDDPHEARGGAAGRTPEAVAAARRGARWRGARYEPEVDLFVSPCFAIELPAEDADELEVRLPLSSFLRWVNLIGWAGARGREHAARRARRRDRARGRSRPGSVG